MVGESKRKPEVKEMSVINLKFKELSNKAKSQPGYPRVDRIVCKDGFTFSAQANELTYCSPRETGADEYTSFEIGYPSEKEDLIMEYAEEPNQPTETVYGWVPADLIDQVIAKHGGLEE